VDRRRFLLTSLAGVLAAPLAAEGQQTKRIAFLCPTSCSNLPNPISPEDQAFLRGLAGSLDAQNVNFDMRGAGIGDARLSEMASRLVSRRVDVIVAVGNLAARAAREATGRVPIVMIDVADPVAEGLIASLGRPGGNVTGLAVPYAQLAAKQVELLREIRPGLTRVAMLWNPLIASQKLRLAPIDAAVRPLGVQLLPVEAATARDLEKAFASVSTARADALMILEHLASRAGWSWARGEIAAFALTRRLQTIAASDEFVVAGGLMSYGPDPRDVYERAAGYAAKIMMGAKPNELPVEEPTRFVLTISRTTAKAIGFPIPPSLLLRADKVIEQ
jgi:putative ABC transport system substrate-binding protein